MRLVARRRRPCRGNSSKHARHRREFSAEPDGRAAVARVLVDLEEERELQLLRFDVRHHERAMRSRHRTPPVGAVRAARGRERVSVLEGEVEAVVVARVPPEGRAEAVAQTRASGPLRRDLLERLEHRVADLGTDHDRREHRRRRGQRIDDAAGRSDDLDLTEDAGVDLQVLGEDDPERDEDP